MAQMGLFGGNLPEEYGCANMNNVAYGLVMQELERGDSGLRSFVSVQGALVMYPIFTFGSEEQKRNWLPLLAKGEKIGCFGLTEPDHGSDPGGMETRARRDQTKAGYSTARNAGSRTARSADIAIVWAKADEDIKGFIVETEHARFPGSGNQKQTFAAGFGYFRSDLDDVVVPEDKSPAESRRPEVAAHVPESGALWNCLGRHRRSDGVL